jgi:DNA-binding HxlR family transcriptional regulator
VIDGHCQTFVSDCHVRAAVELISHAWDPVVLSALRSGPMRRNDLLTYIAGISDKVLTQALHRLQARALVTKVRLAGAASGRVGTIYQLTPLGESFANGPLAHLARWAADNQAELVERDSR